MTYLSKALALAEGQRGFCAPNPAVGAVLVKDNQVIGQGCHHGPGTAHGELAAINEALAAGFEVQDSTLYITLEPCCHHGRTPPCTDAIIKHGIRHVIFAYSDPNPQVAGKSAGILQRAGIHCQQMTESAVSQFYESYSHWWRHKRPFLTAKLAISLDGKIAGPQGEPVSITGTECQQYTHKQRLLSDGILTTVKTVNQDNPSLNVRCGVAKPIRKPVFIVDTRLGIREDATIFATARQVTIFHGEAIDPSKRERLVAAGAICQQIDFSSLNGQHLNLLTIMDYLGQEAGCHDIWLEAGGTLYCEMVAAGLVQRALVYVAPKCLGVGMSAFPANDRIFQGAKGVQWWPLGQDMVAEFTWS